LAALAAFRIPFSSFDTGCFRFSGLIALLVACWMLPPLYIWLPSQHDDHNEDDDTSPSRPALQQKKHHENEDGS